MIPTRLSPHPATRFVPVIALLLGGCVGVAVGAGATAGVAAYQERGIEAAAIDLNLEAQIVNLWLQKDETLTLKLGIEAYEGRILLTGVVEDPEMRDDAVRLAWKVIGVKEVINEIQVTSDSGIVDLARDSWITTQLKSKLTLDNKVLAINYAIETVNGIVYLIGIAQSQDELDRVIAHSRTISYVRRVISHVRVKGTA
jgi:osmotically-inducible protein OsmY